MNRLPRPSLVFAAVLGVTLLAAGPSAMADTLLIDRTRAATVPMPTRGMTMQQVEAQFGAPSSKRDPRGGQKRQWPTIHRWAYPQFTVYFENNRVIDSVVNQASAQEVGPKPAIR
jgi:outer membrane protein assembly factor BamE (lipoprotein component of BamABCDE complex)